MNFVENFKNVEDIINNYEGSSRADLEGATIHLAWYGYGSYCGSSFVLYEKDDKLFEVHGAHCSCYGLEGQWEPEETSIVALAMRDLTGSDDGADVAHKILQNFVKSRQEKQS